MAALDVALGLAQAEHAGMRICYVFEPVMVAGTAPPGPALDILLADKANTAQIVVRYAIAKARTAGLDVDGEVLRGVPFDEILQYAAHEGADAIVMGTHGRSGVRRFVMGSVAEYVVRNAPCPVIVVHEEHIGKKLEPTRKFAEVAT